MGVAASIETIEEKPYRELAFARRFELADLSRHGGWLLKRFAAEFPEVSERTIAGYLNGLITSSEHLFLYQDHAVGLAQLVTLPRFKVVRVLQERFVWCEDKTNKNQMEEAADLYDHMKEFAKRRDCERMIVCENTDVPKTLIEQRLGRLLDTKITHARV